MSEPEPSEAEELAISFINGNKSYVREKLNRMSGLNAIAFAFEMMDFMTAEQMCSFHTFCKA